MQSPALALALITPGVVLPLSAGLTYVAVAYGGQITRRGGGSHEEPAGESK
jgi:hypothetical protein